jgi:uncharacterized protein (DUF2236 family)
VHDFSAFDRSAGGYVRRVRRTVGGMLEITFGDPDRARQAIAHINRIHQQVRGTLRQEVGAFSAGTPYAATDPDLLLWVHATLVDSMMLAYESLVGPLSAEERDRFCAESAETGTLFGIPAERLPLTRAALAAYMDRMYASGAIVVGPDARVLADGLFSPPLGPATRLFRLTRLVTTGLLPEAVRAGYGLPWDARRARTFARVIAFIRRVRRLLPPLLREWPIARAA